VRRPDLAEGTHRVHGLRRIRRRPCCASQLTCWTKLPPPRRGDLSRRAATTNGCILSPRCQRRRRAGESAYVLYTSGSKGQPEGVIGHAPQTCEFSSREWTRTLGTRPDTRRVWLAVRASRRHFRARIFWTSGGFKVVTSPMKQAAGLADAKRARRRVARWISGLLFLFRQRGRHRRREPLPLLLTGGEVRPTSTAQGPCGPTERPFHSFRRPLSEASVVQQRPSPPSPSAMQIPRGPACVAAPFTRGALAGGRVVGTTLLRWPAAVGL